MASRYGYPNRDPVTPRGTYERYRTHEAMRFADRWGIPAGTVRLVSQVNRDGATVYWYELIPASEATT